LTGCSGCSISSFKNNEFIWEDYVCQMPEDKSYVNISALSEEGKTKKVLMIPQTINGLPVKGLVDKSTYYESGVFESDVLEKIYIPIGIYIFEDLFLECSILKEIYSPGTLINNFKNNNVKIYLHNEYIITYILNDYEEIKMFVLSANIVYNINYELHLMENLYVVDNSNYGERIEPLLREPERQGYTFEGWYKETECINKWDYDTDIMPEAIYDENNKEILQETTLYAKWIEN